MGNDENQLGFRKLTELTEASQESQSDHEYSSDSVDLFEVTRVESLLKHPGKYDIYLNGQFAYTVHEDTLIAMKLLKGTKLDHADLARLEQEERVNEAFNRAIRWIGRRPYASQEIERKLLQAGWEEETATAVVEKLKQQQLIDDRSFAEQWTDNRIRVQRKGRHLVRHELMQKGVAKADIEAVVNAIDPDAELESALHLGQKKWRQTSGDVRSRKQKTTAYLMRRGFPSDIVREVIRQYSDHDSSSEDEDWMY